MCREVESVFKSKKLNPSWMMCLTPSSPIAHQLRWLSLPSYRVAYSHELTFLFIILYTDGRINKISSKHDLIFRIQFPQNDESGNLSKHMPGHGISSYVFIKYTNFLNFYVIKQPANGLYSESPLQLILSNFQVHQSEVMMPNYGNHIDFLLW